MQVQLLKNNSNTNSFNRTFLKNDSFEGVLKEGSDMLAPEIMFELSGAPDYNMMYIPSFQRYYFIGWENISNNLWKAYTKEIDVLFTYKSDILALDAIIDKQEYNSNPYIDDGSYIQEARTIIETRPFSSGFNETPSYVLITAGA